MNRQRLAKKIKASKKFRDAFVSEHIRNTIAFQIRENRLSRNLSQRELADTCNTKQNQISRLEDPDNSKPTISSLRRIASAFECALIVRFVPYSELLDWRMGLSPDSILVPSIHSDHGLDTDYDG